ncbi:hypothetical protein [Novosphingobium sp. NBM11]|uniref:hypothetical protein n=1 Tax=Novosphingobium sp. NBM11 TaxID=2596914 RepID=UPI0019D5B658|nr:hypothetical protein [Novosphingobium sp. NBM11]
MPGAFQARQCGGDALVTRPFAEVEVRRLPVGAAAFIEALKEGQTIIDAVKEGLTVNPGFDLTTALRGMIEANVIIGHDANSLQSMEAA